jgi:hypothetical protein
MVYDALQRGRARPTCSRQWISSSYENVNLRPQLSNRVVKAELHRIFDYLNISGMFR